MAISSKIIFPAATILYIIVKVHCVTPDFSDYAYGKMFNRNGKRIIISLGDVVSNETKNLMEVEPIMGKHSKNMYVKIVPKSDLDELANAKLDYNDTLTKINENHPDTISYKEGRQSRRAIGIADVGYGILRKDGKDDVPSYYFVVEYADDYSDFAGATIYCQDNKTIVLSSKVDKNRGYNNKLDVETYKGRKLLSAYARISLVYDLVGSSAARDELETLKLQIENDDGLIYLTGKKATVLEEGEGKIRKKGQDNEALCNYFVVNYVDQGTKNRKRK